MKIFTLVWLLTWNSISAQVNQEWIKTYNGYGSGNTWDAVTAMVVDDSGNVYVTGSSLTESSASYDYVTIKYNSSGEIAWIRSYDGTSNSLDEPRAMAIDKYNNIYITGESRNGFPEITVDYCTIKYNSSGMLLWMAIYNGPPNQDDVACKLVIDDDQNVFVTGWSFQWFSTVQTTRDIVTIKYNTKGEQEWICIYSNHGAYSNEVPSSISIDLNNNIYVAGEGESFSSSDAIVIKYNSSGIENWVRRYDGPIIHDDDTIRDIEIDKRGNIYAVGQTNQNERTDNYDYLILKYYPNGDIAWVRTYNDNYNGRDVGTSLVIDENDGYLYVTGYTDSGLDNDVDYTTIKYDSNGNLIWLKSYDWAHNFSDLATLIELDSQGNVYVSGSSAGPGGGQFDFATVKYKSNGDQIWVQRYDGIHNDDDEPSALFIKDFNIYVAGYTYNNDGTASDFITIKYSQPIGITQISSTIPAGFVLNQNYPNPFNPNTIINYELGITNYVKLKVYDAQGKEISTLVDEKQNAGSYSVEFHGNNLPSGIYFYTLKTGNYSETKRMALIK